MNWITLAQSLATWLASIVAIAGGAGVVSALIGEWFGHRARVMEQKSRAKYAALKAAIHLETFLAACEDRAAENDLYFSSSGHAGGARTSIPDLETFPLDDNDWRALVSAFTERCLSLPHALHYAKGAVAFAADQSSPDDGDKVVREALANYLRLGLQAGDLAKDLRNRYGWAPLASADRALNWMRESLAKLDAEEAEANRIQAAATAEMFKDYLPSPPAAKS